MVLTGKQKEELNNAILSYLKENGYDASFNAFIQDAQLGDELDEKFAKLLEKKWTAIVRLQRRIMQLEAQVQNLQEDLQLFGRGKKVNKSEALPREPAKHTLNGHRLPVTRVLFHPTYNLLVSSSEDCTVRVWDYESGQFERTLKGHTDAVQDIDFNGDGSMLASCSADLAIKLWDFETGNCIKTLHGHDHNISSVRFLPSGNSLVSCSRDKSIKLWDVASGYCTNTLKGHDAWVRAVRVSPDGSLLATASMDQTVKIWNLKTGECVRTLRGHDHHVETIEFTNSSVAEGYIRQMSDGDSKGANGTTENSDESKGDAADAESTPAPDNKEQKDEPASGCYLVSGSRDKTIKLWEVSTGRLIKTLSNHDNWVRSLLFHPSGRYMISAADDKTIRVWDLSKNARNSKTIENAHPLFVSTIAWNKVFPVMASGGVDHSIKVWECR